MIRAYFPDLSAETEVQLMSLLPLYREWNQKINVISRKDMDHFMERHVLHSLCLMNHPCTVISKRVLDVGTGGGFPGIPLAICLPETQFVLVDSIAKKIRVVQEVTNALGLKNVKAIHSRMEDLKGEFDLITSRAVASSSKLVGWTRKLLSKEGNYLFLKGGDLTEERDELLQRYVGCVWKETPLAPFIDLAFYDTKKIIEINL